MFKRVAHICLTADDLAATETFYTNVLGLKKAFDFVRDGETIGFYFDVGDMTFIEIFRRDYPANTDRPLILHYCLEVDDIDTAIETIRARGGDIGEKHTSETVYNARIKDPSGVEIELLQYRDKSFLMTGAPVEASW